MKRTNTINIIQQKILRRILHLRLQPIRVFCFHQVSETFDESYMYRMDWLQTDAFKSEIKNLQEQGYKFIPLTEAFQHLQNDKFRLCKYAVLTADDGWSSLRNILPWLNEQQIPVTLFLNPAYFDGKHYREKDSETYLTQEEIEYLYEQYPLLTIGSHGWDHTDATKLPLEEFTKQLSDSVTVLKKLPNYVPFYAFPYGRYSNNRIDAVLQLGIVPLLVGANKNYRAIKYIDREVLGYKNTNDIQ